MTLSSQFFAVLALLFLAVSYYFDRNKTKLGFKKGMKMMINMIFPLLNILILIAIVLFFTPPSYIEAFLGPNSGIFGLLFAAVIGAVSIIPPFISYPLAGSLLENGASFTVIGTFITSLMMVGVMTLPLEVKYFGTKVAIFRNVLNFIFAIIIGLLIGVIL